MNGKNVLDNKIKGIIKFIQKAFTLEMSPFETLLLLVLCGSTKLF